MKTENPAVHCAHDKIVALGELKPNPRNPNKHGAQQIKLLAKVIEHQGWRAPIVVSNRSGLVVAGHGRLEAAKLLGLESAPVNFQDFESDEAETAHMLADNRIAELAEIDDEVLKGLLDGLNKVEGFDMDLTGFDSRSLEQVLAGVGDPAPEPQMDRAEELREKWKTDQGQLWQIGEHRILCGDSTKAEDVARVMGGEKADLVTADPPYGKLKIFRGDGKCLGEETKLKVAMQKNYGVAYSGHRTFKLKSILDSLGGIPETFVLWGGNYFADELPVTTSWLCWDKSFDGQSIYSDFELAWTNLGCPARIFHHTWQGMVRDGEKVDRVHPTQKPVELYKWILEKLSQPQIVLELFLGSGTTLVACEQLGRRGRGIEISPGYVAVCLERLSEMGLKPELIDG